MGEGRFIYIIIEAIEINKAISLRDIPQWKIRAACIDRASALQWLYEYMQELSKQCIISHIDNEILFIDEDRGFNIGKRYLFPKEVVVYGPYIEDNVYHLVRYTGHDRRKPYGYDTLGWYTDSLIAKYTKEWQILSALIHTERIAGLVLENEIKLYGPYGCEHMLNLFIECYPVYRR